MQKEQEEIEMKKEYLKGYEKAVREMSRHEERIQEIRLSKLCPAVKIDGMPRVRNHNDLSSYAAILDQEEKRYLKARYRRVRKCKEISDRLERLENEDEKDVLMYRYIRLMKWEDIADRMGYSWQHIHKIHARAVKNFII